MIQLIYSEDDLLADERIAQLREKDSPDTEVVTLAAEASAVPGLEEALFSPSLFATHRMVLIEQAERMAAAGAKALAASLQALRSSSQGVDVVVVAVSERPPTALEKALAGIAKSERLGKPKRGELVAWVTKRLRSAGVVVDKEAPGLLIEAVGSNLRDLSTAVEQLTLRAGNGGTVGREQVHAHFPRLAQQPVWALFDALGGGDSQRAYSVLRALFDQGEDPIGVLFSLVSQVRYVMRARSAIERAPGLSDVQLGQAVGVSPGRAGVLRRQASKMSWEWLRRVHGLCADADFELKGRDEMMITGILPPELIVERVIDGCLPSVEAR